MALSIESTALADPTQVAIDAVPVMAQNVVYGGTKTYYHSQSTTVHVMIAVITFTWEEITAAELATIRAKWQVASTSYPDLEFDGLRLPATLVTTDKVSATVYPGSNLEVEYSQGWDSAGTGPILYNVSATFAISPAILAP